MSEGHSGALMVCGTASGVGKSVIAAGLCRALARRGVSVAPFKAQNMSNNAAVTRDGGEIGRAQWSQALACGVEPEVAMNPVLLKPLGETESQVVVMGRPAGVTDAAGYGQRTAELLPLVSEALAGLRARFDAVILEGAGGAAEINLLDRDIVNLRLAASAGVPALLVGDIEGGGVFASLYGTVALVPPALRACVAAFVINKFRGDPALLVPGVETLTRETGVPTAGVVPWAPLPGVDEEDTLALAGAGAGAAGPHAAPGSDDTAASLDVAVVRLPRIANFTDVEPLAVETDIAVRYVDRAADLGRPDLVVVPGSRNTVADLDWMVATGMARAVEASPATVLGICGGFQMMGSAVDDTVESGRGRVAGLGWLPLTTLFEEEKVTRHREGRAAGERVVGYEIRHGRPRVAAGAGWMILDDEHGRHDEGAVDLTGRVYGTSLHGIFESDGFRRRFLAGVASRAGRGYRPGSTSFASLRARRFDALADLVEDHLDMGLVMRLLEGTPAGAEVGR